MKELLRISMSEAQVREACKEFAEARASVVEPCSIAVHFPPASDMTDGVRAEVVFTRKRARANGARPDDFLPTEKGIAS